MGDFLNHMDGGMGFYQEFPPFSFTVYSNFTVEKCKRSQGKAKAKAKLVIERRNSEDFFSGFGPRIRPQNNVLPTLWMTYVNATTII
jgi:hypothetical protein